MGTYFDLDLDEKNIEVSGSSTNHDVALGSLKNYLKQLNRKI